MRNDSTYTMDCSLNSFNSNAKFRCIEINIIIWFISGDNVITEPVTPHHEGLPAPDHSAIHDQLGINKCKIP